MQMHWKMYSSAPLNFLWERLPDQVKLSARQLAFALYLWLNFALESQVGSCFERATAPPVAQNRIGSQSAEAGAGPAWLSRTLPCGSLIPAADLHALAVGGAPAHPGYSVALSLLFWFAVACASLVALDLFAQLGLSAAPTRSILAQARGSGPPRWGCRRCW